ncbi:MAG: hypothetical protein DRI57_02840 [Deltaproteobacteria bacterium]|nr:MAG: hypothetical protein DRI57_02840 [Deltaproteobacteria bacterium]
MKMKKFTEILGISMLVVLLSAGSVFAFGTEITISDENASGGNSWHNSVDEDQEVEVGMNRSQEWDMEGFFLDGNNNLSMVGGYDFVNGLSNLASGDVFIDVDGDAIFGAINGIGGNRVVEGANNYDYVLDMDFDNFTYDVYELTDETTSITSKVWRNQGSNPWRYNDGGNLIAENVGFGYQAGLTDAETGFRGDLAEDKGATYGYLAGTGLGSHYAVTGLDLDFLASDVPVEFVAHFTMQCGNDNLMGRGNLAAVTHRGSGGSAESPEPATMFLLGAGLVGLAAFRKRFVKKA